MIYEKDGTVTINLTFDEYVLVRIAAREKVGEYKEWEGMSAPGETQEYWAKHASDYRKLYDTLRGTTEPKLD